MLSLEGESAHGVVIEAQMSALPARLLMTRPAGLLRELSPMIVLMT